MASMNAYEFKPLPMSEVFDYASFNSAAPLFQLPYEILVLIINAIPRSGFEGFALTSRDCYRIARSRQLVEVRIRLPGSGDGALCRLAGELQLHEGTQQFPPLGKFVRHLFVSMRRAPLQDRRVVAWQQKLVVLLSRGLPNLESLMWSAESKTFLPTSLLPDILNKPFLRNLSFDCRWTGEPFVAPSYESTPQLSSFAPLRLELTKSEAEPTMSENEYKISQQRLERFLIFLRNRIHHLVLWSGSRGLDVSRQSNYMGTQPLERDIRFPNLTTVELEHGTTAWTPSELNSLIALFPSSGECKVHTLIVRGDRQDSYHLDEWFTKRGPIKSLKTIVWEFDGPPIGLFVAAQQPQLTTLCLSQLPSDNADWTRVISRFLSSRGKSLTTLMVPPLGRGHEDSAMLEALAQLHNLQHLSFGATESSIVRITMDPTFANHGRRYWKADHSKILYAITSQLSQLRTLAFALDAYEQHPQLPYHNYYTLKLLEQTVPLVAEAQNQGGSEYVEALNMYAPYSKSYAPGMDWTRYVEEAAPPLWEREHRERMSAIAEQYFNTFPQLTWLYVGQLKTKETTHGFFSRFEW